MVKEEIRKKLDKYVALLNKNFILKQVVLFGSFAKGTYKEFSDIDVAVFIDEDMDADYWEDSTLLFKLIRNIDARIEPVLFYADELKNYEKASFVNEILSKGEIIYPFELSDH